MRRPLLIACAGILALWVGGCGSEDTASTPEVSPSPAAEATQSPTATQGFAKPLVAEKNAAKKGQIANSRVPGLLQSTDPEERARQVQAGINVRRTQNDPFASLPPLITLRTPAGTSGGISPSERGNTGTETARQPQLPDSSRSPQGGSDRRTAANPPTRAVPQGTPSAPGLRPSVPTISALPPLPEPTLARAVEVSGVVVVGGTAQAIVKAPNESTSRYVSAGQRLSNGQILVKRIEVNAGSDPIVILEQNGIEVSRGVGEKSSPAGAPTALSPSYPQGVVPRNFG
ncbi:hypothetical protein ACKFKF_18560 [Phormidesmis sp. 146-12]